MCSPAEDTIKQANDESNGKPHNLRVCPFCGSDAIFNGCEPDSGNAESLYYVECETCGGRTGLFDNKEWAVKCWNCRSTLAELEKDVIRWHPYPQEKPTKSKMCAIAINMNGQIIFSYSFWHTSTNTWHKGTNELDIVAWHYNPKLNYKP